MDKILPFGEVRNLYMQSFLEIVNSKKIRVKEDEEHFAKLVETFYNRHAGVLVTMARGAFQLRDMLKSLNNDRVDFFWSV